MKTGCPYSVFLISCLLSFVCRAEKVTEFSTVEVNARQGKKTSITLLVPEKTDLDKFMRTNRMMAGMWAGGRMQRKKGGKPDEFENATRETKTHWIGDVHYPIFNYQGVRLYMIGGIKIRKSPAIENLPPEEKEVLLKVLRTRGDLVLKETGKPKVATIQLDSSQQRPAEHWQNAATMQSSCAG